MAELALTAFLSLDGVMQAPGGPDEDRDGDFPHGGWVFPHANSLPKHVASSTRTSLDWRNSFPIRDVVDGIAALKQRCDREIQVHGSMGLAQTLMENDLVDEYRLLIFPAVLGRGKRLFDRGAIPATLTLRQCSTTGSGAVYCVYRRAGPLKTGSFALE